MRLLNFLEEQYRLTIADSFYCYATWPVAASLNPLFSFNLRISLGLRMAKKIKQKSSTKFQCALITQAKLSKLAASVETSQGDMPKAQCPLLLGRDF